jgi:AraC-like DNA-binding protein
MLNGSRPPKSAKQSIRVWRHPRFDGMVFHRGSNATHPYPRHWHDELHLCAYTAGAGYLRCRGVSTLARAGNLVLTPPSEVHDNWVTDGSVSFLSVYISDTALRRLACDVTENENAAPDMARIFRDEFNLKQSFLRFYFTLENEATRLECDEARLSFACALLAPAKPHRKTELTSFESPHVRRSRSYIDEHWSDSISLVELSNIAGLSPFHLHRMFTRQTGLPPHAYQTQLRINHAKVLLRARHSLAEIASLTGFADQSHFTRHFHRSVGVSPGRYASSFQISQQERSRQQLSMETRIVPT